ncbi:sigma-70 family RNA polymerase sigma factor [Paenibacillus contaminans]|uniref:RNA polymerase subunit sigma-70 n=1 Tax=Paenibacillus contaminans TaxID=450362 RepID=A0A329MU73_9BACL|nr:sigma-70 family RNA polymerase sigma factor [Paenibacillus contaminans]RAV23222.1 RNA polymerase subunit sigma-70 [Paenibacillus contaminans]
MDKKQLAAAAVKGDEEAFLQIMNDERQKMMRVAYAYLRNEADALEAIQETVCRAWLKRKTLRQPQYVTTWLIRILIHVCADELKRRKRSAALSEDDGKNSFNQDDIASAAERIDMAKAISRLEKPYKDVILLKYYEDMTITDIAEVLQRPDGTVRTWLNKALVQLRKHFNRLGGRGRQDG